MKKIKINLKERNYEISIGNGLLNRFAGETRQIKTKNYIILSVKEVFSKYGQKIKCELENIGISPGIILIPDGEKNKNEKTLFFILKKMAELGVQRDACLVSVGGGVVGDVGGFAASIYMRGIKFIQIPTTLLAQVDASIGGKTGIDFYGIKNLIGSFHQPSLVLIDPLVLKTIDKRQYKTGLAEVIKYGIIQDEKMFREIEENTQRILNRDEKILLELIEKSCGIKARIVSADEKENGKRIWLNYGHTLGHALESYFDYKVLTHGEAISHGMVFAARLSQLLGFCDEKVVIRQKQLLEKMRLLRKFPSFNPEKVLEKMSLDKKARNGQTLFVLTRKIGLVTIQKNIPRSTILSALIQYQESTHR